MIKEQYPHAVSGAFRTEIEAETSIASLIRNAGLERRQVKLIRPDDKMRQTKVEPDSRGIFRTMLSAHLWTAIIGFVVGIGVAVTLVWFGPAWAANNPVYTIFVFAAFGAILMMLVAGLLTLRPDRDLVSIAARDASRMGHWTVVAHCKDHDQMAAARDQLQHGSLSTYESL